MDLPFRMQSRFLLTPVNAFLLEGKEVTLEIVGRGVFKKSKNEKEEVKYLLLSRVSGSGKLCTYPVIVPEDVVFLEQVVFQKRKNISLMTMSFREQKSSVTCSFIYVPRLNQSFRYFQSLTYKKKRLEWELVQIDGNDLC